MDFGKVPSSQLDAINFRLPTEPESNRQVLPGVRAVSPKIYIGCPRWGVKEWVGKLYPTGIKESRFLEEYIKQFTCIELNSTFYNLYDKAAITKWAQRAGDVSFRFLPKIFQGISHDGSLHQKQALTLAFQQSVNAFGALLGPSFLQLSDRFGPGRKKELAVFLEALPEEFELFVEVRHPGWFAPDELSQLVQLLKTHNKGLIITDTAGRRDCCHLHLTLPKTMIRFVANNLHPTDFMRIEEWVEKLSFWIAGGLQEVYFIIHMEGEKQAPELAATFIDKLNAAAGLTLKKPVLLQQALF